MRRSPVDAGENSGRQQEPHLLCRPRKGTASHPSLPTISPGPGVMGTTRNTHQEQGAAPTGPPCTSVGSHISRSIPKPTSRRHLTPPEDHSQAPLFDHPGQVPQVNSSGPGIRTQCAHILNLESRQLSRSFLGLPLCLPVGYLLMAGQGWVNKLPVQQAGPLCIG